jgi:hypothetical protein
MITGISAQDPSAEPGYPSGSPIIRIFANVYHGLTDEDRSKAFEVRRVYLGYLYELNEYYSTEIKMDIGSPDDISEYSRLRRYAYFKTAALYWESGRWNIRAGIIDTEHFRRQEKYWKHRYIYKSMQDQHKFGPKADLGTTVIYTPTEKLSADASIMNGEGYSNLQRDNNFKYSAGLSFYPVPSMIMRVYYDLEHKDVNQSTLSTFLGYQQQKWSGGMEYNRKFNQDFRADHHQTGLSFYMAYDLNDRFEVFGRFDQLSSNIPGELNKPWNLVNDGSAIIAGVQFHPIEQVKLALNYQDWVPSAGNMQSTSYIFLNLEVSL